MKRPFMLWPLVLVLVFLAMGGFSGGIPMLADPANGGYLDFGEMLPDLPVSNFILPGLFLLIVMGIFPLFLAYTLIAKPSWGWINRFFQWSKHHWSWTGCLVLVGIITIWLGYEGWLVGWWPITYATAVMGGLILIIILMPSMRKFYKN